MQKILCLHHNNFKIRQNFGSWKSFEESIVYLKISSEYEIIVMQKQLLIPLSPIGKRLVNDNCIKEAWVLGHTLECKICNRSQVILHQLYLRNTRCLIVYKMA